MVHVSVVLTGIKQILLTACTLSVLLQHAASVDGTNKNSLWLTAVGT